MNYVQVTVSNSVIPVAEILFGDTCINDWNAHVFYHSQSFTKCPMFEKLLLVFFGALGFMLYVKYPPFFRTASS